MTPEDEARAAPLSDEDLDEAEWYAENSPLDRNVVNADTIAALVAEVRRLRRSVAFYEEQIRLKAADEAKAWITASPTTVSPSTHPPGTTY